MSLTKSTIRTLVILLLVAIVLTLIPIPYRINTQGEARCFDPRIETVSEAKEVGVTVTGWMLHWSFFPDKVIANFTFDDGYVPFGLDGFIYDLQNGYYYTTTLYYHPDTSQYRFAEMYWTDARDAFVLTAYDRVCLLGSTRPLQAFFPEIGF